MADDKILPDSVVRADNYIAVSTGAADQGRVPKLDAAGLLDPSFFAFGGNGSNGALNISSGTTTIDCANAAVVVLNYTTVSITGTGKLAFSNPHANGTTVIIKVQGNVTLTSSQAPMIDMSGMGAAGGNGGAYDGSGLTPGSDGKVPFLPLKTTGGGNSGATSGQGGLAGSTPAFDLDSLTLIKWAKWFYEWTFCGAGGGGGSGSNNPSFPGTGGAGGRGGGNLIIECGGAWNFTTASGISVKGANGSNGSGTADAGGGAGGNGGCFRAFYRTLTANTGTITITGGTGGIKNMSGTDGEAGISGKSLVQEVQI